MKLTTLLFLIFCTTQAGAVDQSQAIGKDTTAGNFAASVVRPFTLADGTVVNSSNQISGLRFRSIWIGGARMTVVINGKEKHFSVPKNVSIENGYAYAYINTSAASTGQGIGVQTSNQAFGAQKSYERQESRTCYSRSFDVCLRRDPSICKYNVTASGIEEQLVQYTEQNYRAQVNLTDASGRTVARLGYDTKDFNRRTLRTLYSCDAEDYGREKRQEVRRELRRDNPVESKKPGKKPKKPRKH